MQAIPRGIYYTLIKQMCVLCPWFLKMWNVFKVERMFYEYELLLLLLLLLFFNSIIVDNYDKN